MLLYTSWRHMQPTSAMWDILAGHTKVPTMFAPIALVWKLSCKTMVSCLLCVLPSSKTNGFSAARIS